MPRKSTKSSDPPKPTRTPRSRQANAAEPLEETIRRRAYELHLERGGAHGGDLDDWLRAEREIGVQDEPTASSRKAAKRKS